MENYSTKSVVRLEKHAGSTGYAEGHMVPQNPWFSGTFANESATFDGYMVPNRKKPGIRAYLDGNFARRKHPLRDKEYCVWDTDLAGFGMRIQPTGRYFWFVRLRHRGKHRRVSLGRTDDVDGDLARTRARRLLAEVALDGLPKRTIVKASPTLTDFVATYWSDIAHYWKASTAKRNLAAWRRELEPVFGATRLADITQADVTRWRDDCVGAKEARFNRAIPVLASLLKYAEALHLRRKGSNPTRGMPRYKRAPCERYLTPLEYRRLGAVLRDEEIELPINVAIVRLLLYTGARISEIRDIQWEWVRPPHLCLPDSKTGPKLIWLNSQALTILEAIPRRTNCEFVFPNTVGSGPINIGTWWYKVRRRCATPDVRIHDLRHSFASTAIMDNVPLATIGKLLGHFLPETTAKYAHLADDVIADAAQRISGGLAQDLGLKS